MNMMRSDCRRARQKDQRPEKSLQWSATRSSALKQIKKQWTEQVQLLM